MSSVVPERSLPTMKNGEDEETENPGIYPFLIEDVIPVYKT